MAKESVQYIKVEESEKVIAALAICVEKGLAGDLKKTATGPVRALCSRVEKTSLDVLLQSSANEANAVELRYQSVLSGSALMLVALNDLFRLAEITAGIAVPAAPMMAPEILEACVKYFADVMDICNVQFCKQHNHKIESESPEMINPDGNLASLKPLAETYEGVLCLTFELSAESQLECKIQMLIQPDLKESLMFLLPNYLPDPQIPTKSEEGVLPQKETVNAQSDRLETTSPKPPVSGVSSQPSGN